MESTSSQAFDSDEGEGCLPVESYNQNDFTDDELNKNMDPGSCEDDKIIEQSVGKFSPLGNAVEPYIGMEFNSRDEAREFYVAYGRHTGFTVRIHHNRRSRINNMVIGQDFVCSKEGFREKKYVHRKDRVLPPPPISREGCPAMLRVALRDGVKWVVTKFVKDHNHSLMSPSKVPWRGSGKIVLRFWGWVSAAQMGSVNRNSIENLTSARKSLRSSLEKSKTLSLTLEKAGPRFDEINHRLPPLEAAVRPIRAQREALVTVGGHINRAVVPAAAVLKVFDAIHGLEKSLSDPQSDLPGYLSVLKRLEEALRFLGDNCGMAIQWLDDIVEYLEDNKVADDRYIMYLKKALKYLRELQNEERGHLDGGLLGAALDRLENEFRRLLTENSVPLPMSSSSSLGKQACIAPSPLPVPVIQKLQAILGRLIANNRLEKCISIYVEVRSSNVRASLQALNLDYLEISISEFNDVQSIEGYIAQWSKHLEFAVKHLFEAEYKLCNDVFERMGLDVWMGCFAKIAAQAGILAFLQFGKTVTESKKDPIKLLKLLDIFASLNKLRLDFNRLFGGTACAEIQNLTRDLIKRVIEGASEIFWELLVQVELQRQTPPPSDGNVPRLMSFITDYCNRLLGEEYKPILTQALVIQRSWKQEKFQERLLIDEVLNLIRAIELNLETWSKAYDDAVLSHLFMMNNHWHLYKHLKGTMLGNLLGDSWLREHEQYKEYYSAIYLRESWGKLPALLSREGLIVFSGGRATARDLVKKRLKAFNEAFDDMYKKQSSWVVMEKDLREKTCQLIVQAIVPIYRSYMQNYGPLVEQDASASKYAKYTAECLEKMLGSLFQPKSVRYGSFKVRQSSGKFSNGVADQ